MFDPDEPDPVDPPVGTAGPSAVTVPGVDTPVGRTMETLWPTDTGGSFGLSGTETVRSVVVTV